MKTAIAIALLCLSGCGGPNWKCIDNEVYEYANGAWVKVRPNPLGNLPVGESIKCKIPEQPVVVMKAVP
jgi:hypothetical protein